MPSAVFSPDGQFILTASLDETAILWSVNGKVLTKFIGHSDYVVSAVFSSDGQYILTASDDKTARLWDRSGNNIARFEHSRAVTSAGFSPEEKYVLTASEDGTAKIWPTPQRIYDYLKNEAAIPELTAEQRKLYGID
jgi:WD40 repeat protein